MKAYVSIDFEGLPGIASISMLSPKSPQYKRGVDIVTRIARVVAEALIENGFDRVVIADSHGSMANIDYLEMPRGTTLIQGFPRPYSMVTGINETYDALFMIGYHAGAGTLKGFLDHTYSGRTFYRIYVNNVLASEYLLNALVAGEYGVPVALVAGDSHLGDQVKTYTPWTVFVPLKTGISRYAAEYPCFDEVVEELRRGIYLAVQRIRRKELRPLVFNKPLEARIEFRNTLLADATETIPGVERIDPYTIVYKTNSAKQLLGLIEAIALMGIGVDSLRQYLV